MGIYARRLPTVKQLQYFLAVCEERSFRRAAIKLGISQPPLSIQIKSLEESLSTILILRNTQKFELTKDGIEFRDKARHLLTDLCLISESFKKNASNKCVLGMTNTLNFNFIPLFDEFFCLFSNEVAIYKDNYTSKDLLTELQKENIDFALISDYPDKKVNYYYKPVYQESVVLALPITHSASKNELVDLNEVCDLSLYWFNRYQNPHYYDQCEVVFKKLNHTLTRIPEMSDTLAMLLNVSLGKAMLFLPSSMAQADIPGVVYKKLIPYYDCRLFIDLFLVWRDHSLKRDKSNLIIDYFC